jgi:hypothetical protein
MRAIILPRVSDIHIWMVMYAELMGNHKKQRIKSLCDNILMWSLEHAGCIRVII